MSCVYSNNVWVFCLQVVESQSDQTISQRVIVCVAASTLAHSISERWVQSCATASWWLSVSMCRCCCHIKWQEKPS